MKWLLINKHFIPSLIFFFSGFILLALAPILYQIRVKKIIILNPIKALMEYTKSERWMLIVGTIFLMIGLASLMLIAELYGYYYFKDGVPTLLKKR